MRQLRPLAGAALALLAVGCEQAALRAPVEPYRPLALFSRAGDGKAEQEYFEVCKTGSSATFDVKVTDLTTGTVETGQITLADGGCQDVALRGGVGARVEVTEQVPAGYLISSVDVTVVTGPLSTPVYASRVEPGPTVTDTIAGRRGVLAVFHNAPIPPPPPTEVIVCKDGTQAAFETSVNGGPVSGFGLTAGTCQLVHTHAGGTAADDVVITELVPAGIKLDSIIAVPTVGSREKETGPNTITVTADDQTGWIVTFYNSVDQPPPPPEGGQGCTPGYWKQPQHFDSWASPYTPTTLFSDVFENAFPGKTLLDVLKLGGGGLNALGRHTVAALLNAVQQQVSYDVQPADVIAAFNAVYPGGDYERQKNLFAGFNEQGCPLN